MVWTFLMIMLPAMMLKTLHYGYTRFYLQRTGMIQDAAAKDDDVDYSKCPVHKYLKMFGIPVVQKLTTEEAV